MKKQRIRWDEVIEVLNESKYGRLSMMMGSPGSAQVTRCRLLETYSGIEVHTEGEWVILRLTCPGRP